MEYKPRISTFFLLIGLGLLVFFILMGLSGQIKVLSLLLAVGAFIIAAVLRPKKVPAEPARFAAVRRMNEQNRKRRQERWDKKHKR